MDAAAAKRTLVAVEDSRSIVRLLETLLTPSFDVTTFERGDAFENWLGSARPPDACILDLMLPGVDGFTLLQNIRGRDDWKQTKVIILTSRHRDVDRNRCMALGADAYVVKPFEPRSFREQIDALVSGQPQ